MKATEDREKVAKAVANLFTGPLLERQEGDAVFLTLETSEINSLERFRMIIQRDRIRAAAGAVMRPASDDNGILVFLNKQVAFVNHVSFCEPVGESPLGPIRLKIESTQPRKIVDWVTGGAHERSKQRGTGPYVQDQVDTEGPQPEF